jgi:hypothetical protein
VGPLKQAEASADDMGVRADHVHARRNFRTWQQAALIVAIGILLSAFFAVSLVSVLTATDGSGQRHAVAAVILAVALLAAVFVCLWRAPRAGIIATDSGIIVRNLFRSVAIPWKAIDHFAVEDSGVWTRGAAHLRDGTVVLAWGIQGQARVLFPGGQWATDPIAALNELLRTHADDRAT